MGMNCIDVRGDRAVSSVGLSTAPACPPIPMESCGHAHSTGNIAHILHFCRREQVEGQRARKDQEDSVMADED